MVFENTSALQMSAVSPDGRWIALDRPRTSADSDILLADVEEGGEPLLITEHDGNIAYGAYTFTPDSSALIYATNEFGEWNQAWSYDIASGERAALIEADWDVMYVGYSPSGQYRANAINADGFTEVSLVNTATGEAVAFPASVPAGDLSAGALQRRRDPDGLHGHLFGLARQCPCCGSDLRRASPADRSA
jgi:hypothetical protein